MRPTRETSAGHRPWVAWLACAALVAVACLRIVATHEVFSQTIDEATHLAAGLEWLDRGIYEQQAENPPLSRVAVALGPYLAGARALEAEEARTNTQRDGVLYQLGNPRRTLRLARLGTLPFFMATCAVIFGWSRRRFGSTHALCAVGLYSTLPPVLAHAGFATTDTAASLGFIMCAFAIVAWIEAPTPTRTLALAGASALAFLTKFSLLPFLALFALGMFGLRLSRAGSAGRLRIPPLVFARSLLIFGLAFSLLVWAGYRFSLDSATTVSERPHALLDRWVEPGSSAQRALYAVVEAPLLPATEVAAGLRELMRHNEKGHQAYLLGETSETGFWSFFLVALLVKTPLAFLLLAGFGLWSSVRRTWRKPMWAEGAPAVAVVSILLVASAGSIHIGLRHILPIYPMLAIAAGGALVALWRRLSPEILGRALTVVAATAVVVPSLFAHPDYLAEFNVLAGSAPEDVLVDSDLDWGQDLFRLEQVVRDRSIPSISLGLFTNADLSRLRLPEVRELTSQQPVEGWVAVSLFRRKVKGSFNWLDAHEPVERVGTTIDLYYVEVDPTP